MNRKGYGILLSLLIALSLVPAFSLAAPLTIKPSPSPEISSQINRILEKTTDEEVRVIIAPEKEGDFEVYKKIAEIGEIDPISKPQFRFIVATIPRSKLEELKKIEGISGVWLDRKIELPKPEINHVTPPAEKPDMFLSIFTTRAYDAWTNYDVLGDNVRVAVLDTGVDMAHPFLQVTLDGKPKIIDVFDATDEGLTSLTKVEYNSALNGFIIDNVTYTAPSYSCTNVTYYFGMLPERYFDINFDGNLTEIPALVVVCDSQVIAALDLDLDNDFTEPEYTINGIYHDTLDYILSQGNLSIALASFDVINETAAEAYFFWDGHGHGTHVSGTIAGVGLPDDPYFRGVYGMAPNAQIMGVRVLISAGYGYTSWIIYGMIYAAAIGPDGIVDSGDEADVINMSLGGWLDYNDNTDNPENFYVNYLSDRYGVVFSISAGNNGPALNTGGAPGTSDFAITVGAYVEGVRWEYLYGVPGVKDGLMHFSSRGPRMDGMLDPDVMAPGGLVFSSVPIWYKVAYNDPTYYWDFWSGTSMAAPHVSGAAALLISYAKAHNLTYDPLKIKQALMLSAYKYDDLNMVDQGFGLIQVDKAIEVLTNLSSEESVMLYAGVPVTTFRTLLDTPWIPANGLNSYFVVEYGLPYLYGGIYLRNEYPVSVPVYVYSLNYNGTLKVYSSVDWVKVNSTEISVAPGEPAVFDVKIDYDKISEPGLYEGIIYIDNPETTYLEGFVPVTVLVPEKPVDGTVVISGEHEPKSMRPSRYFFEVPEGVKKVEITVTTNSANEAIFQLVPPYGTQMLRWLDYSGFGLRNRTITFTNPTPGTWELVVYAYPTWTTKDVLTYTFEIKMYGVEGEPSVVFVDLKPGEEKEVEVKFTNRYATVIGNVFVTDDIEMLPLVVGDGEYVYAESLDTSDLLYVEAGALPLEPLEELWIEMGLALESNYPMYRVARGGVVDAMLPEAPMYVYAEGEGGDWLFYLFQILRGDDNTTMFSAYPKNLQYFLPGDTRTVKLKVRANETGTYFGAVGIEDQFGNVIGIVPIVVQVGEPELEVQLVQPQEIKLGEEVTLTLWVLDKATMQPVDTLVKVVINGKVYYTASGKVEFKYIPTSLDEEISVEVISPVYADYHGMFKLNVVEPVTEEEVKAGELPQVTVAGENVVVESVETAGRTVEVTVNGETGEQAVVMVTLPLKAKITKVEVEPASALVKWWTEKGENAQYVFVEVQFASSVTVRVSYTLPVAPSITMWNFLSYTYYKLYLKKYEEYMEKAKELGVDEETIKKAEEHYNLAISYYNKAIELAEGSIISSLGDIRLLSPLRQAYLHLKMAVEILEDAIKSHEKLSE
ncbi:MAG: hypothetical protein PWP39_198 [Pyrococcus sp.]|uniref:S8 family peptidase n=1 Tax=Pyrococcus sp. TaxID=33866 RepID=UPI00258721D0|nr:S8 family serine peptidase [Pyrococcus sp.]MDK2868963.1 hypothetical protein [Pyrococcus sp.]